MVGILLSKRGKYVMAKLKSGRKLTIGVKFKVNVKKIPDCDSNTSGAG